MAIVNDVILKSLGGGPGRVPTFFSHFTKNNFTLIKEKIKIEWQFGVSKAEEKWVETEQGKESVGVWFRFWVFRFDVTKSWGNWKSRRCLNISSSHRVTIERTSLTKETYIIKQPQKRIPSCNIIGGVDACVGLSGWIVWALFCKIIYPNNTRHVSTPLKSHKLGIFFGGVWLFKIPYMSSLNLLYGSFSSILIVRWFGML